jgi:aspartate-semialdehyde dehydrogenase
LKKKEKYNVAIVGTRGAVGSELCTLLAERKFPIDEIHFFGSARSKGAQVHFGGRDHTVWELTFSKKEFEGIDLVFASPGSVVSKRFAPLAVEAGAVVIDNTSAFRMDPKVPLVIPEINGKDIKKHEGIIANPNCSTIILLMAIAPLHKKNKIKRVVCSTYQSASGAGRNAMEELWTQTQTYLSGRPVDKKAFPHQIAFNLFSHDSSIAANGSNEEENKVVQESKKILHDNNVQIAITCIRVPVLRAHSESINLEFARKMTAAESRKILASAPGVRVVDDPERNYFPMPLEASGQDDVLVGRVREDSSTKNGLALFVSGDQLRKGAALNAVQIAEALIKS